MASLSIPKTKGLTGFQLKVIALILMTFDHIHYIFTGILDIPMWFTMLGRLAAPIFTFMLATGMHYTHSREKYMLRLYIGSVCMSLLNSLVGTYFPHPAGVQMFANIFATLFLISLFIYLDGKIKDSFTEGKYGKLLLYALIGMVPLFGGFFIFSLITAVPPNALWIIQLIAALFPFALTVEGGFPFIILGIGFYLCGQNKIKQTIFYLVYCVVLLFLDSGSGLTLTALFTTNIQWMMVFALILILLYNGQRGRSVKYFFYFYYPIHIYVLYFLAILIAKTQA